MAIKGTFQFPELSAKPSAPPAGSIILYVKTDNVMYVQDSSGTEYAFGSVNFLSALHGDVTAVGPGDGAATVNSVGGSSAADIHSAELLANAATPANSANQIIKRDALGNYAANVGALNALKLFGSVTGILTLAAPTTFTDYTLILPTTFGTLNQALLTDGAGNTSWGSVLLSTLNDGKILVGNGSNVATPQTPGGDISMTDLAAFTVNTVGTSSAANIHSAELLANAATSANTASTIVKRSGLGDIFISVLNATSGNFIGTADVVQLISKGFAGQGSDIFQVQKSDSTVFFKVDSSGNATVAGTIAASNFSGSFSGTFTGSSSGANTGDVTLTAVGSTPDARAASLSGQVLTLQPADGTHPGVITELAQSIGGAKTFIAPLSVTDTTQSTSSSTGSAILSGGLGVTKNINAGGNIAATGTITGSNFSGTTSGTNTGDVTKTDTDSIAITLAAQLISANLKLSSDPADVGNLKITLSVHSGAGAGLHAEAPYGIPVNIGVNNSTGSDTALALRDHVHAHAAQVDPTLHAVVTTIANGFMSAADKTKLDTISATAATDAQILVATNLGVFTPRTMSGDVAIADTGATTIQPNVVSNSKLAQMPLFTLKGNNTGSTANALDLTSTQVTAMLNPFVGDSGSGGLQGLVPAPAAGDTQTGKFLKADGTWAATSSAGYLAAYFTNVSSDVVGYKVMAPASPGGAEFYTTDSSPASGNTIATWITPAAAPGITIMPTGLLSVRVNAYRTGGTKIVTIYAEVYIRSSLGVETLLSTTSDSIALPFTESGIPVISTSIPETEVDVTDRLVVKVKERISGSGSNPTSITLGYANATGARLEAPALAISATSLAVPQTLVLRDAAASSQLNVAYVNTVDTISATDLPFNRNGTEGMRLQINASSRPALHIGGTVALAGSELLRVEGAAVLNGTLTVASATTTAIAVNTTDFVVDGVNHTVGIGTQPAATTVFDIVNNTGSLRAIQSTTYGFAAPNRGRYANGTLASPTAATTGNSLHSFSARGYGATGFAATSTGVINIVAGETFTDTSMATYIAFSTTPTTSVTAAERMRINSTGRILMGTTTDNGTDLLQVSSGMISQYHKLAGTVSGNINFSVPSTVTSYPVVWPATQGAAGTFPSNDGAGNLSWTNPQVNIDGGTANSVYTSGQFINGGTP